MSLDPSYLDYPKRRPRYDHDLYDWSPLKDRAPVGWQASRSGSSSASNGFRFNRATRRFAPGHMATPYPDYRHYTSREYGTRIGFYRLLDAFAKVGARVSVATNGAIAERYPRIIADIVAAGHEIVAHSTDMNGTIATGLSIDDERALIATSLDTLERATGTRPSGWLSIARSESWNTPDLLRAAGVDYTCDWVNDELPWRFANGLVNLPINHQLGDRQILSVQQQSSTITLNRSLTRSTGWQGSQRQPAGGACYLFTCPRISPACRTGWPRSSCCWPIWRTAPTAGSRPARRSARFFTNDVSTQASRSIRARAKQ